MTSGNFKRDEANKLKRLHLGWRRPRGLHNKRRLHRKGHAKWPSPGFGSSSENFGKIKGLIKVRVFNISDLEKLDSKKNIIEIASTVGTKKRLQILEKAKQFKIVGINDIQKNLIEKREKFEKRKQETEKKKEEKEKTKKELEEKEEKEEKKETKEEIKKEELEETKKMTEQKEKIHPKEVGVPEKQKSPQHRTVTGPQKA